MSNSASLTPHLLICSMAFASYLSFCRVFRPLFILLEAFKRACIARKENQHPARYQGASLCSYYSYIASRSQVGTFGICAIWLLLRDSGSCCLVWFGLVELRWNVYEGMT